MNRLALLLQGDVIGLEQQGKDADTLHICMLHTANNQQKPDLSRGSSVLHHAVTQQQLPSPNAGQLHAQA